MIHEGIPIREAKEFFSFCPDYDESYSEYQVSDTAQRIKGGRLNHPTCESLKSAFTYDEKQCKGCPRKAEFKNKTKARDSVAEPRSQDQVIEVPQHIKDKALDIMTKGDAVRFILDNHQKMHIGDVNLAKSLLVSIGIQSVLNSEGIHPKVNGESGKGKTHCCKAMAHLLPEEYAVETTLSDKAIYYMNLRPGSVVFSDDVNLSEALEGIIKRSTSNYQQGDNYTTIDINRNVKTLKIPPRVTWWLTSVDDDQSMQLLNRQFGGGVDESPEQDEKVAQFQLNLAVNGDAGLPENDDVRICREIIRQIKKHTFLVRILFATYLDWKDKSNRRNLPIFLDIIKAFAVLRFRQRPVVDGYLLASIEDYESARELYCSRAENQCLKLTEVELNLCRTLHELNEADSKTLENALGLTQGRIHHLIHGRKDRPGSGLLHKVKGLHCERRTIKNSEEETATKNYYSLDNFDVLSSYGSVVNFPEDKKAEYNRYYSSLIAKNGSSGAITTRTDNNSSTITSITSAITSKTDNSSGVITTITQNEDISSEEKNITDSNTEKNAIHSKLCNNGNNPATAIDINGNSRGNSGNSLSINNDFIINNGNSYVIDSHKVEQIGREWEQVRGEAGNSTNITDAVFWVCGKTRLEPSVVRPVLERIFKITPAPEQKQTREIQIPFNAWSKERLKKGVKAATSRTKRYGNDGDYFKADGAAYVLTAITEKPLKEIAENCYKAEGAESPEEFIQVWKSLHPEKGFVPEQVVFYHEFKPLTGDNGDQNQETSNPLTAKLKHYHQFFKQDVRTGKKLNSLAQVELEKGNKKAAFREYFTHYCPEYMNDAGKVDSAISVMQSKGELQ